MLCFDVGAGRGTRNPKPTVQPLVWGFEYLYRLQHRSTTWGLKPNGAARDCGSRFRGFDSLLSLQVLLGPVLERHSCNAGGEISIFSRSTSPGFVARMGEGVTLKTS